ncbi:MAG: putative Ig domain-containing protein [Deinococcales bacterium]
MKGGLNQLEPDQRNRLGGIVPIEESLRPLNGTGSQRLAMKLLVISATNADSGLATIELMLKQVGVPYDVLLAVDPAEKAGATGKVLTSADLIAANGDGKYQGIILTDGSLGYDTGTGYASAFSNAEWNLLWQYAREYQVRQVSLFTFPGTFPEDLGLRFDSVQNPGLGESVNAKLAPTPDNSLARSIFASLKPSIEIPVTLAYTYLATIVASNADTKPLLVDAAGKVLAALSHTADGREVITLTMGQNVALEHSLLLSYDLINWVSQGVHLGERRMYLQLDVDDWYQFSSIWDPATQTETGTAFQLSGPDVLSASNQVIQLRNEFPQASGLNYAVAFVSKNANAQAVADCNAATADISSATQCIKSVLYWINHTYTERVMNEITATDQADPAINSTECDDSFTTETDPERKVAAKEIRCNIAKGQAMGLAFSPATLITSQHSGLGHYKDADGVLRDHGLEGSNLELLIAAANAGIKYMGANHSVVSHQGVCETCGRYHPLEPRIFLIPRYPTNIFYNVTNPTELVSEFNYLYGPQGLFRDANGNPFFSSNQNYSQVLDFEAKQTLNHILNLSPYPHFFHQANLDEYQAGRSLVYDWARGVLERYTRYYDLPLITLNWQDLAQIIEERTSFYNSQASGIWDRGTNQVIINVVNEGYVYVSGVRFSDPDLWSYEYGPTKTTQIYLGPSQSLSGTVISPPNRKPALSTPANQSTRQGQSANLAITATDADGDSISYSATGLPTGLSINAASGLISGTVTAVPGSYTVTVNASDSKSKVSANFTWTITANQAPTITKPADQSTVMGASASLAISASDADGDALSYSATGLPTGLSINASTGLISGTVSAAASSYPVSVSVTDPANTSAQTSFIWTITQPVNNPPLLSKPANQTSASGTSANLTLSASDPDGDALSFSATGLPTGLTISATSGVISGTITASAATYNVTATVRDSKNASAQTSFTWTVTAPVNNPPVVTKPANQTSVSGTAASLAISASDPDGDAINFSVTGLPTGLSINATSGLISGTVTASAGTYTVTITVKDSKNASVQTNFTWTVTAANNPPIITKPANQTTVSGTAVNLAMTASDPDGDSISFSSSTLPTGLSINATSGLISGTITAAAGTYNVTVSVKDSKNASAQTSFTWTVTAPIAQSYRYIRLVALSSASVDIKDDLTTSLAELHVFSQGAKIARSSWKVKFFDSQETSGEDGKAINALDGNTFSIWITKWSGSYASRPKYPHQIIIDLGQVVSLSGFSQLPRQDEYDEGLIRNYVFYGSNDSGLAGTVTASNVNNFNWTKLAEGSFSYPDRSEKRVNF